MATMSVNNNDRIKSDERIPQPALIDVQLFATPDDDDETDLDGTTIIANQDRDSSIQPRSDSSMSRKRTSTRSYRFIRLERALVASNLLRNNDDRVRFENEYLIAMRDDKFDEFLENYYQKLQQHHQCVKQEEELRRARVFTFVDLEKNFLALDPTRDVKIVFVDKPTSSLITKSTPTASTITNTRSATSAHQRSTVSVISNESAIESFYANRSNRLLADPARAREEITSFARRAAERLHERLPRMSSVPHRVKIVDDRDLTGKPDERTLLQMKHKRALSLISKRRHVIFKMMTQTKKNQLKMEEHCQQSLLNRENSSYCHELLERANQIEQIYQELRRPQTTMTSSSQRASQQKISSAVSSHVSATTPNSTPTFLSTTSKPFQDALSIHQVEKKTNVRVLLPTRPLTAPKKVNWVNYC